MPDKPIETKRFQVHFGHAEGGQCNRLTMRVLDCVVEAGSPRVDISTWGDPGIKDCQFCGQPLTRGSKFFTRKTITTL